MKQGFTLLELLIVIAIIGLLASIILVSYKGSTEKARLAKTLSWAGSISHLLGDQAVGVWTFDNIQDTTVYDDSGLDNNGVISGAVQADGVVGKALSFNGSDDYVYINNVSLSLRPNILTRSFWIKPNDMSANRGSYSTVSSLAGDGANPDSGLHARTVGYVNTAGLYVVSFRSYNCTGPNTYLIFSNISNDKIILGQWAYITEVISYTNPSVTLYINGKFQGIVSGSSGYVCSSNENNIWIGRRKGSYENFSGLIDDFRIFSEALPQARIEQLYADGLATHPNLAIR